MPTNASALLASCPPMQVHCCQLGLGMLHCRACGHPWHSCLGVGHCCKLWGGRLVPNNICLVCVGIAAPTQGQSAGARRSDLWGRGSCGLWPACCCPTRCVFGWAFHMPCDRSTTASTLASCLFCAACAWPLQSAVWIESQVLLLLARQRSPDLTNAQVTMAISDMPAWWRTQHGRCTEQQRRTFSWPGSSSCVASVVAAPWHAPSACARRCAHHQVRGAPRHPCPASSHKANPLPALADVLIEGRVCSLGAYASSPHTTATSISAGRGPHKGAGAQGTPVR